MNPQGTNIYIVSDVHLGVPDFERSLFRERKLITWLESIRGSAQEIIILGDLFDFWFEYGKTVPKGYVRLLGKLAELTDSGIPISLFAGNHDLWYKDYFPKYLGIPVFHKPVVREWFGKKFFLAHGDGLGPGDIGYKMMKKIFTNPVCKWLFKWFHPDLGIGLADFFSHKSRKANYKSDAIDYGEKERLFQFTKDFIQKDTSFHYFIFGHRHLPKTIQMNEQTQMFVLGDWISYFTYLEIQPNLVELKYFQPTNGHLESERKES